MKANKFKKTLVTILCICFFMTFFLPQFYIFSHEHHDCMGKDCVVCSHLKDAKSTLNQLGTGVISYRISVSVFAALLLCIIDCFSNKESVSLVTLKIRMDN